MEKTCTCGEKLKCLLEFKEEDLKPLFMYLHGEKKDENENYISFPKHHAHLVWICTKCKDDQQINRGGNYLRKKRVNEGNSRVVCFFSIEFSINLNSVIINLVSIASVMIVKDSLWIQEK